MELLPPVGWADVATKHDLVGLESRIDARFDRIDARFDRIDARFAAVDAKFETMEYKLTAALHQELRSQTWKLFALVATVMGAVLGALVGIAFA